MNGLYVVLLAASIIARFSIPLVMFALLMRLVGRIGTRALGMILGVCSIPWAAALFFWVFVEVRGDYPRPRIPRRPATADSIEPIRGGPPQREK